MNEGAGISIKLLLGGKEDSMERRLDSLVKSIKDGHVTTIVYPLGGERDLWPIHEEMTKEILGPRIAVQNFLTLPEANQLIDKVFAENFPPALLARNEALEIKQARENTVAYITKNYNVKWPTETNMIEKKIKQYKEKYSELENVEFIPTINAPKKLANGVLVRPDTKDSFVKFFEDYGQELDTKGDKPLTLAIITEQPYGHYQKQQAIAVFHDKNIVVSVLARGISGDAVNLSVVFDTLARMVYSGKDLVLAKISG